MVMIVYLEDDSCGDGQVVGICAAVLQENNNRWFIDNTTFFQGFFSDSTLAFKKYSDKRNVMVWYQDVQDKGE